MYGSVLLTEPELQIPSYRVLAMVASQRGSFAVSLSQLSRLYPSEDEVQSWSSEDKCFLMLFSPILIYL